MIKLLKQISTILVLVTLVCACGKEVEVKEETETLFSMISVDHSNLIFKNSVTQTKENNHIINSAFISGGGVAVGDINNDGLQDIFLTGNQVRDKLFLNKGNFKFEDISLASGISKDKKWSSGVTFVDIDNDGDQDIYVCRNVYLENEKSANQLYINNGDLTFTEQAELFGLADKGFSMQAFFSDFDKDGLIDLYVVNQPPSIPNIGDKLNYSQFSDITFSDRLYRNVGNGKFVDHTIEGGIRNFGFGLSASVGDLNKDGWPDIYVTNDFDVADHMYINQQNGTFVDSIRQMTKHISNFSMGSDIADYDNDGNLDVMVVDMMAEDHKRVKTHMGGMQPEKFWEIVDKGGHYQYMFNTLQRNNGNGTFSELAQLAGVTSTDWSWAPLFADFDNDGYKDLFVTNGVKSNNRNSDLIVKYEKKLDSIRRNALQRGINPKKLIDVMDFVTIAPTDKLANYIYRNNGDYTFSNSVKEWGMDVPTLSNGAAYADFDNDGDLDLVVNNIDENAMLFKNNTRETGGGNYLRFKLNKNKNNYGTKIVLYDSDKIWQVSYLSNGRGYMSKSEDIIHFGVGDKNIVEKAVIKWYDGSTTVLRNVVVNKVHEIYGLTKDTECISDIPKDGVLFKEITTSLGLNNARHKENSNDDYKWEVLLPHKMSQFGPSIAVGDINGDRLEDFFLGGAAGYSGMFFIQNMNGTFSKIGEGAWSQDKASEDMGIALVDVDGDKDLDLFIVSGGNEFDEGDNALQDRLYINNGHGKFSKKSNGIPKYLTSGSCVLPYDFDNDGDMDLFIGGRLIPRKYPLPANSHLLENKGGYYIDVSKEKIPGLINLGMVTSGSWFDYNKDGLEDLIVAGEWMPITIFMQSADGKFEKQILDGLNESSGWYYAVETADMDNDGDEDIVVGNLGLNCKYKASIEAPFEVYSYDFDENGELDIVLSYYEHGESYPVRGKSCSTQQIPMLGEKFKSYEQFGGSNLANIYGKSLESALNLKSKTFASAYIENLGNGKFRVKQLPALAQTSSVNSILLKDYDLDGNKDILIVGNLYPVEVETPRNDASVGLFLKGSGKGNFSPFSIAKSGFFAPKEAKDMKWIKVGNKEVVLVANNDDFLQAFEVIPPKISIE